MAKWQSENRGHHQNWSKNETWRGAARPKLAGGGSRRDGGLNANRHQPACGWLISGSRSATRLGHFTFSTAHAADDALTLLRIHRRTLYKAQGACKMVCEARK